MKLKLEQEILLDFFPYFAMTGGAVTFFWNKSLSLTHLSPSNGQLYFQDVTFDLLRTQRSARVSIGLQRCTMGAKATWVSRQ